MQEPPGTGFGAYLHVPFCTSRCDYCAFATWDDRGHLVAAYAAALAVEVGRAVEDGMPPARTVYFGGGTPSLLSPDQLYAVLSALPTTSESEVTVECNPETVDAAKLAGYREAGVSRVSFGVQSMDPEVLVSLGRRHDPAGVRTAVEAASATGFGAAYSVDLIMGAAGETVPSWAETLEQVLRLDPAPSHVSAYGLTVEPGTPLARDPSRYPDPDDQADKYELADERLTSAGLDWYELSNWARPGHECRHNLLYWAHGEYRGFGCAAHSHARLPGGRSRRWWNVRTPERYLRLVGRGEPVEAASEELDAPTVRAERQMLALRTRDGIGAGSIRDTAELGRLVEAGLVVQRGPNVSLTRAGRLLANEVALRLIG